MKPARQALIAFAAFAVFASPAYAADSKEAEAPGFNELDKDDDGKLSRSEALGNRTLSGKFKETDADGDGFVTRAEYLKTMAAKDFRTLREKTADFIRPDDKASTGSSK
jgi:Ca2+-binding EF-hand superfamily protein